VILPPLVFPGLAPVVDVVAAAILASSDFVENYFFRQKCFYFKTSDA
jgi:hypothetical protein